MEIKASFLPMLLTSAMLLTIAVSQLVHEYYVITTRCNVTHDDTVTSARGVTHCGAVCLGHSDCTGFRFVDPNDGGGGGCYIYGDQAVSTSVGCGEGGANLTDIYVEQIVATAQNMTWIPTPSGSTDNGTNTVGPTACLNNGGYDHAQNKCVCVDGWIGSNCENLSEDCSALQLTGQYTESGIYFIHPSQSPTQFKVYCFLTELFGLTQIQAHLQSGNSFNRSWSDYKDGFTYNADLTDYWLGNDYIHYLSTSRQYRLLVDFKNVTESDSYSFRYYNFVMDSEHNDYSVTYDYFLSKPTGLLPCWPQTVALPFSTYDRDNDGNPDVNCASLHGTGWWFESGNCTQCNVNGLVDLDQNVRQGSPSEAFALPIDPEFNPQYTLMALYWLP